MARTSVTRERTGDALQSLFSPVGDRAAELDTKLRHHDLLDLWFEPGDGGWIRRSVIVRYPTMARAWAFQMFRNCRFHVNLPLTLKAVGCPRQREAQFTRSKRGVGSE